MRPIAVKHQEDIVDAGRHGGIYDMELSKPPPPPLGRGSPRRMEDDYGEVFCSQEG